MLAAVVAVLLVGSYLSGKPDALADEYRDDAMPAARAINAEMDRVYASFDEYLEDSVLPPGKLKGIDDFDELARRLVPLHRNTKRALKRSQKRIAKAKRAIAEHGPALAEVPDAFLVSAPDVVGGAASESEAYLKRLRRFLGSYSDYVSYAQRMNSLNRRSTLTLSRNDFRDADSRGDLKRAAKRQRREFSKQRRAFERIKPHNDAAKLHRTAGELNDAYVDWLDDFSEFLDSGDLLLLIRAEVQLFKASRRLNVKQARQFSRFERSSGLQRATRSLTERANQLESSIEEAAATAFGEERKGWKRPPLPKQRDVPGKKGGDDDKQRA